MALLICLVLVFAMTGHSSATYCLCKDGVSDQALQKTLDYACGAGADCTAILQNGACYNPNTLKDHCNYAVNSYFQNKGQVTGSCDFSGAATVSSNPPTNIASTCSYPSSSTGTTPTTGTTTGTPPTGTTTGTPTVFGGGTTLGPTGTTTGINDASDAVALFRSTNIFVTFIITLWIVRLSWI
ncbi:PLASMODESMATA CALLOSE-BINDING PROTEIN 3-like [Durio zibethinus]|uniref:PLASMODESMATA CALLOSE-BINDING PROTEIN 3-like n=1 Tax=Durio zibethinus TaxID=66656 RepID=A0A6P5XE75_DURZI|nr:PLASMODESMATA CALLOSE-BINDING PROTEIN 3-like [Durio zibethinus]